MLCDELGVAAEQLVDFELCLADTQPAAIGGALEEFIFSPRLDNLLNAYCACQVMHTGSWSLLEVFCFFPLSVVVV